MFIPFRFFTVFLLLLPGNSALADSISGAGSSAAQPLYHIWAWAYTQKTGVAIAYDPVGSSAGVKKIKEKSVDFGASDVAMSSEELQQNQMIQFPSAISGIVPVINLPGIRSGELKLNGTVLAGIFSGRITRWNDEIITALNPNLALPKAGIVAIARIDGSGSTYNFSDYLSRVSPIWKADYGTGFTIKWPNEIQRVKGSAGIAAAVRQTAYSISYVDYNYVIQDRLTSVLLKNADGNFVAPTPANFESALNHSDWKSNGIFTEMLTDRSGPSSWPVTMGTFIIMPRTSTNIDKTIAALKFFAWGFMQGDRYVNNLDFVHLPDSVQAKIFKQMMTVTDSQGRRLNWSPM